MFTATFFILVIYLFLKLFSGRNKKTRNRRPPFKKLYDLDKHQPITEFERKMVRGMFAENREIFVTAFVTETHVLRVTATIGSKYSCRASDNINLWGVKAQKIGASKIKQYHNHPDVFGRSFPSNTDKKGHRNLKPFIERHDIEFQSLLVYKSWFGKAVIKEYH